MTPSRAGRRRVAAPPGIGITAWALEVDAVPEASWPWLAALLDAGERQRAACFHFERHRRQYQAAHALKRLMLSAAMGGTVAPEAWTFEAARNGKPRVTHGAGPHFNLSHCDGLVACAVSPRVELGIDVECLNRRAPLDLTGSHLALVEEAWVRSLPAAVRSVGFFRLWTLKEAYLKATGLGLSRPLDSFAFGLDPIRLTSTGPAGEDAAAWRFKQQLVGPRHMLALAWRVEAAEVPVTLEVVGLTEGLVSAVG